MDLRLLSLNIIQVLSLSLIFFGGVCAFFSLHKRVSGFVLDGICSGCQEPCSFPLLTTHTHMHIRMHTHAHTYSLTHLHSHKVEEQNILIFFFSISSWLQKPDLDDKIFVTKESNFSGNFVLWLWNWFGDNSAFLCITWVEREGLIQLLLILQLIILSIPTSRWKLYWTALVQLIISLQDDLNGVESPYALPHL